MRYSQYKKQMFGKHVRYKGRKPRWSTQQMQKEEFTGQREVTERRIAGNFPVSWAIVTIEIMIMGAMVLKLDFHSADRIALALGFMVLYSGVVIALADK